MKTVIEYPAEAHMDIRSDAARVHSTSKITTVFTNGCFDLFHAGHVLFLNRCRALGDRLIVGLNSDDSVRRLKGSTRPICTFAERSQVLLGCRYVDEVLGFDDSTPCRLIQQLRPDIIVKGPGYSITNMPEATVVEEYGGRVVLLDGPPISSTEIIGRILSNSGKRNVAPEMARA